MLKRKQPCPQCGRKFHIKGISIHMRHCPMNNVKTPGPPTASPMQLEAAGTIGNAKREPDYFEGRREGIKEGRVEGIGEVLIAIGNTLKFGRS